MKPPVKLPQLASRWPRRFAQGRRRQPCFPEVLYAALLQRRTDDWGLLEWMHVIRHKARWDIENPDKADGTSEQIWRVSIGNDALQGQLVGLLVEGLCGGAGLSGSMIAACARVRPLEKREPLLQDIVSALLKVDTDPTDLIDLCMHHNRSPRALMRRVGLPDDLDVLDRVEVAIPDIMRRRSHDPKTARPASQWLLAALLEDTIETRDVIAKGLLAELSMTEAKALPDLCFWMAEVYGPDAPNTRFQHLSSAAQQTLREWIGA